MLLAISVYGLLISKQVMLVIKGKLGYYQNVLQISYRHIYRFDVDIINGKMVRMNSTVLICIWSLPDTV